MTKKTKKQINSGETIRRRNSIMDNPFLDIPDVLDDFDQDALKNLIAKNFAGNNFEKLAKQALIKDKILLPNSAYKGPPKQDEEVSLAEVDELIKDLAIPNKTNSPLIHQEDILIKALKDDLEKEINSKNSKPPEILETAQVQIKSDPVSKVNKLVTHFDNEIESRNNKPSINTEKTQKHPISPHIKEKIDAISQKAKNFTSENTTFKHHHAKKKEEPKGMGQIK